MSSDYNKLYNKILDILGELTPLTADCGQLCSHACCKGDENTGMRLFPFEESKLPVKELENGVRLVVCDGSCEREERPLSCRIFPFFPTVDEKGRVYIELDMRAKRLCPLVEHADDVLFDKKFLKALKKAGKLLAKDEVCLEFLRENTEEIDTFNAFLGE